jgi:hypothetical protein
MSPGVVLFMSCRASSTMSFRVPIFVIPSTSSCHFERSEKSWHWGKDFSVASPHFVRRRSFEMTRGGASQAVLFFVISGVPLLVISRVFNRVISSVPSLSFRAPLPVISSEARNLGLGEKISQSPPLTFVRGRSFEMTGGSPPLTSFGVSSFEMTRGVLLCSPIRARKGSFEMTGGASQAVLFFVIWGVPLLVISPVFNHVISSTFFCHFERSEKS